MKYTYYPGCSLAGMGRACEESLLEVLRVLKVESEELPDWNCCGATAYMAVDEGKAETRRYIKRQATWISGNMKSWKAVFFAINGKF